MEQGNLKLLAAIVDRGRGKAVVRICASRGVDACIRWVGHGTAPKELLAQLGLGQTEKDIVFCIAPEDAGQELLLCLSEKLRFDQAGNGIAFTVPLGQVYGTKAYAFLAGAAEEEG